MNLVLRPVLFVGEENNHKDQNGGNADADAHTGLEHITDGGTCHGRVDHHDDARRNNWAETAGDHQQTCCSVLRIPHLAHFAVQNRADRDDRCGRRPGERGKESTGKDQRDCHAASDTADDGSGEITDSPGNTTLCHQVAGKDKECDRHDGSGIQTAENSLCHRVDLDRDLRIQGNRGSGRHTEGEGDGYTDDQEKRKSGEHNYSSHFLFLLLFRFIKVQALFNQISALNDGDQAKSENQRKIRDIHRYSETR